MFMINQRFSKIMIRKQAEAGLDQDTIMYGKILKFIADNEKTPIFQKDVEKVTGLNKSTISLILSNLEKRGYVLRKSVPGDARLKSLSLSEEGKNICKSIKKAINQADKVYENNLTAEEQDTLLRLLLKIENNITEMEDIK